MLSATKCSGTQGVQPTHSGAFDQDRLESAPEAWPGPSCGTRLRRRARASLVWGLLAFCAFQAALDVAMDGGMPELRDPDYACRARNLRRRLADGPPNRPALVFLGSSRTAFGIHAGRLEQSLERELKQPLVVFNFGMQGAGPLMQLLALRRMLAEGLRPDLLVVEVVPPFLGGQPAIRDVEPRYRLPAWRLRSEEVDLLERYGVAPPEKRLDWWQAWLVPCYGHRYALVSKVMPSALPQGLSLGWAYRLDPSGWTAHPGILSPAAYDWAVNFTRSEYAPYFAAYRVGGPACRALREILERCRQERIAAALMLMPEGRPFQSWYPPGVWDQVASFVAELSETYGAPVLNVRQTAPDEDFFDSHHLLPHGAIKLADRLAHDPRFLDLLRSRLLHHTHPVQPETLASVAPSR